MQAYGERIVETAFIEHRSALVRRLTAICRDPEAAQDIAQEAFLRLAREVDAGREPDNTGAWLHRVGSNLAMSHGRHVQVAARHEAQLPKPAEPESPERIVVESELASAVGVLLDELSQTERRALVLAATGVGGIEIASTLGRTPGATRTLLCRARAKLRERIRVAGFAPA